MVGVPNLICDSILSHQRNGKWAHSLDYLKLFVKPINLIGLDIPFVFLLFCSMYLISGKTHMRYLPSQLILKRFVFGNQIFKFGH